MDKNTHEEIKESLSDKHISYVLITCDEPLEDGKMSVEMSYGGDPIIAEYLVHTAQSQFDTADA